MKVKYSYSKSQFDNAVTYIASNNKHFLNKPKEIRDSILETMDEMAGKFPNPGMMGTMGFTIISDVYSEESIDYDNNSIHFDILVDPALSIESWDDEDYQESTKIILRKEP